MGGFQVHGVGTRQGLHLGKVCNRNGLYSHARFHYSRKMTNDLSAVTATQLRQAGAIKERIEALEAEMAQVLGGEIPVPFVKAAGRSDSGNGRRKRGAMSAAAKARIAKAQKARWAKWGKTRGK